MCHLVAYEEQSCLDVVSQSGDHHIYVCEKCVEYGVIWKNCMESLGCGKLLMNSDLCHNFSGGKN